MWEPVANLTTRLEVEGGWIYRHETGGAMVFVPAPPAMVFVPSALDASPKLQVTRLKAK